MVKNRAQVSTQHPHAAEQTMSERTRMWGRSSGLQGWLWENRKMLRAGTWKEKARAVLEGEAMWTSSQIKLVALNVRLTLLCLMLG